MNFICFTMATTLESTTIDDSKTEKCILKCSSPTKTSCNTQNITSAVVSPESSPTSSKIDNPLETATFGEILAGYNTRRPQSLEWDGKFPCRDSDINDLSEEEIIDACNKAFKHEVFKGHPGIARISENTIVKHGYGVDLAEARTLEFIAKKKPSIRVPKVIRTFQKNGKRWGTLKRTYIVMEFMKGTPLSMCWEIMSETRREHICNQVVDAITDLRTIKVQTLGPIGGKNVWASPCKELFSTDGMKAKSSIREFEAWYDFALDFCKRFGRVPQDVPAFKDSFGSTLVMSHLDIATRNIILQEDDTISIIDWEFAGAYPTHFERLELEQTAFQKDKDFKERILRQLPEDREKIDHQLSVRWATIAVSLPD